MLKPASIFADHMVLCRGREIRIFGEGEEGALVTASISGNRASGSVRNGRFMVLLPPLEACTGLKLTLNDGTETLCFCNVAVGEVFFAGGQSNMELELQNAEEGPACIAAHDDPDLRFFTVPKLAVLEDAACAASDAARWEAAAPGALKDVSAVSYFFARKLRAHLGIPVGVIGCYWGGTSASAWIDEEGLCRTSAGQKYLQDFEALVGDKTDAQYDREMAAYDAEYQAWCARVDALRAKEPDVPWVRINQEAGVCPWPQPAGRKSPFRPAGLAETMLKRVAPYTLTGFLYYQGEEDTKLPHLYDALLSSLVLRWRELFMDDALPFLNVQLPMFIENGRADDQSWAVLRLMQERVYQTLRHTGLAVLIDLGEFDNIHPTDKRPVGERLFEEALTVIYGQKGAASPRAQSKCAQNGALTVRLNMPVRENDGGAELFEIAGEDGVYYPAAAEIKGDEIRLRSEKVAYPVGVRYAHVNYAQVRVFGENGLPLAPFELR